MKNIFVLLFLALLSCGQKEIKNSPERPIKNIETSDYTEIKQAISTDSSIEEERNKYLREYEKQHKLLIDTTSYNKKRFSLIINSYKNIEWIFNVDSLLLYSKEIPNKTCYLINFNNQCIKKVKTKKHKLYRSEVSRDKVATTTDLDSPLQFDLAYISDTINAEWPQREYCTDMNYIDSLNTIISLFNNYNNFFNAYCYHDQLLEYRNKVSQTPKLEKINFANDQFYLLTYSIEFSPKIFISGPIFLIHNKKIYPISGICTSDWIKIININGKYYFYIESNGCVCGVRIMELYEFDGNNLKSIIVDGSWST